MSTRLWFARDAQFTADPKIQMLGHEHGPGGALVVEEVFALAKLAGEDGRATVLYAQVAGRAFVTATKAKQVITRAGELGVLNFVGEPGAKGCCIDLPRWSRWQVKDATAAARKAKQRANGSRESHAAGRDIDRDIGVTVTPPTVDIDRNRKTASSGEPDVRVVFDEWVKATGRTGATVLNDKRRRLIRRALTDYSLADVLDAVRGWRMSPHHRGENDSGTIYNDIELLLRDAGHIEKFRDLQRGGNVRRDPTVAEIQANQRRREAAA